MTKRTTNPVALQLSGCVLLEFFTLQGAIEATFNDKKVVATFLEQLICRRFLTCEQLGYKNFQELKSNSAEEIKGRVYQSIE